jgi:hypothetical protein
LWAPARSASRWPVRSPKCRAWLWRAAYRSHIAFFCMRLHLRHSPTSPVRSHPPFGLWPSRNDTSSPKYSAGRYCLSADDNSIQVHIRDMSVGESLDAKALQVPLRFAGKNHRECAQVGWDRLYPLFKPLDSATPHSAPFSHGSLCRYASLVRAVCVNAQGRSVMSVPTATVGRNSHQNPAKGRYFGKGYTENGQISVLREPCWCVPVIPVSHTCGSRLHPPGVS